MKYTKVALGLIATSLTDEMMAATVLWDFRNSQSPGQALDSPDVNRVSAATVDGVTITATATSTIGDQTAVFNAGSNVAGVNTDGAGNSVESSTAIDSGEVLTITLTYGPDISEVILIGIGFDRLDSGTGAEAAVRYPSETGGTGTTGTSLSQGEFNFIADTTYQGISGDWWYANPDPVFENGDFITFANSGSSNYNIKAFYLDIVPAPVPEPSVSLLMGFASFALLLRKRK